MDLLVVGGIGVDVNVALHTGQWPLPEHADVAFVQVAEPSPGHAGSGVALQAAALGLDVTVADAIGDDGFGDLLRRAFPARGVRLATVTHPAGTRRSVNLVRADGSRLSLHDPRHPYEWEPADHLWAPLVPRAGWVHVVIVSWARHALRRAVEAGVLTSTDLQDWDGRAEHHRDFAYSADVVFCSAARLDGRLDELAADVLDRGRARLVVITRGAEGSVLYERGRDRVEAPAAVLDDRPVVDTNGAGDAFCAAFMTALIAGEAPEQAARRAGVAAAYACSFPGTNTALITATDLAARLAAG